MFLIYIIFAIIDLISLDYYKYYFKGGVMTLTTEMREAIDKAVAEIKSLPPDELKKQLQQSEQSDFAKDINLLVDFAKTELA